MILFNRRIRKVISLLLTFFIPTRLLRRRIRRRITNDQKDRKLDHKMKLGATYSVWDGEELLEASLKSIRENVDYINVVWQKKSWRGQMCSEELPVLLKRLQKEGLVDRIIEYKAKRTTASRNERYKRQVGLDNLKGQKCTHFLIMDVDEFYIPEELKKAKSFIIENGIEHSACSFYNYTLKPIYRKLDVSQFSVQFITKLEKKTKLRSKYRENYAVIDPTRVSSSKGKKCFYFNTVHMHHMGQVRKDLKKKYMNSSAFENWSEDYIKMYEKISSINDQNYLEHGLIKVKNIFDIPYKDKK